jgi:hypothetical protein
MPRMQRTGQRPCADVSALRRAGQRRRRGIFVESRYKTISSSVGAAYPDDVAPTELDSFLNRQATQMSALTGFSKNGKSSAIPSKIRAWDGH